MSDTNEPFDSAPFGRCYQLVGRFFFEFNLMESAMNWAIGAALDIDNTKAIVIGVNVDLFRKLYILRTAVAVSPLKPREKKRYTRYLNIATEINTLRNKIAHHPFGPDRNGTGLEIYIAEAKGVLTKKTETCSKQKMDSQFRRIHRCYMQMKSLADDLKRATSTQKLVDALLQAPNPYSGPLSFFGSQLPPVPGLLGSLPQSATDETSPRNDDDPRS